MKVNKTILIAGVASLVVLVVLALAGLGYRAYVGAQTHAEEVAAQLTAVKKELIGYTQYGNYLADAKQALIEKKSTLAVTVVREQSLFRHVQKNPLIFRSDADVILHLAIKYAYGFDLAAEKVEIVAAGTGIQVTVGMPILLAPPSVKLVSVEVLGKSLVVDEDKAAAELMKQVPDEFAVKGGAIVQDEEIKALCEKKLIDFLRSYLEKQPGVELVPNITIKYPA